MSNAPTGRYQGKRFRSLIFISILLTVGYYVGDPDGFGTYAATLGTLYGAYLAGQSATDWKNGSR